MKASYLIDLDYIKEHIQNADERESQNFIKELEEINDLLLDLKEELYDNGCGHICCCITPKTVKNFERIMKFIKE